MNSGPSRGRSRAQILAVTAVVVSILFIGLIGTIYIAASTADERATGPADYVGEADGAIHTATYGMENVLLDVNSDQSLTSRSARETAAREGIQATAESLDANGQFNGRLVDVELQSYGGTETPAGTRVIQNTEGNLSDASGNANWTVISGADQTRQAAVKFDPYELPSTETDATQITLTGDRSETVSIYRNGTDVALAHSNGECRVGEIGPTTDDPFATVRLVEETLTLTNGGTTVGGVCTDYEPPTTVEEVKIANGNQTIGTLGVVSLGNSVAGPNVDTASSPPAAGAATTPISHHVVYGVPVELTVATERTTTTRLVVVAPGSTQNSFPNP